MVPLTSKEREMLQLLDKVKENVGDAITRAIFVPVFYNLITNAQYLFQPLRDNH